MTYVRFHHEPRHPFVVTGVTNLIKPQKIIDKQNTPNFHAPLKREVVTWPRSTRAVFTYTCPNGTLAITPGHVPGPCNYSCPPPCSASLLCEVGPLHLQGLSCLSSRRLTSFLRTGSHLLSRTSMSSCFC